MFGSVVNAVAGGGTGSGTGTGAAGGAKSECVIIQAVCNPAER